MQVIGTSNPYGGDMSQGTSQMLLEMERQPMTEMEILDEDEADITG